MPADKLSTRIARYSLRGLTQLGEHSSQRNARSMNHAVFNRLVGNVRRDGLLTSTPLLGRMQGDARLYVLSGNHRVAAAIEAGIEEADCMEIVEPLAGDQFTAIQLSHNAIEGEDDIVILQDLYVTLNLELKEYSGLTDEDLTTGDLKVFAITGGQPLYIEYVFGFLADDAKAVEQFLISAARWGKKRTPVYLAPYQEFTRFFEAIVRVKEMTGVTNSAMAMSMLIDFANERLDQLSAAERG
ncbi:MAG: ParB N-terminal domain-containing protein [Chromatiales bacterium]